MARSSAPAQDPVEVLRRLVAFPSVSARPLDDLAAWLAEQAEDAGMRVERFETSPGKVNVVASAGPTDTGDGRGLALCGHMDVVPVEGQDWSQDPFTLTERQGALYGRGACDMKGFLAAAVAACHRLPLDRLQRELVLIWTHDEEVGGLGSAALSGQLAGRRLPAATWIGEPTDFRMCRYHPGHLVVTITCRGRAAHSSRPALGLNAIQVMAVVIGCLDDLAVALQQTRVEDLPGLPAPYTILNPACVHGGTAVNIVPDRCTLQVGLRPPPGISADWLVACIEEALAPLQAEVRERGGGVEVVRERELAALLSPAGSPMEVLLRPHAAEPDSGGAPFGTDGGNLAALGATPVVFGPGSIDVAHRPDEYLEVQDLLRAAEMIQDVARTRCLERP